MSGRVIGDAVLAKQTVLCFLLALFVCNAFLGRTASSALVRFGVFSVIGDESAGDERTSANPSHSSGGKAAAVPLSAGPHDKELCHERKHSTWKRIWDALFEGLVHMLQVFMTCSKRLARGCSQRTGSRASVIIFAV
jgi:hypothetical protein